MGCETCWVDAPPTKEECAALEQKLGAAVDARKAAAAPDSPPEDSAQQANAVTQATPPDTKSGAAWGQNDLPLQFKGSCVGSQTDVHDLSVIQNTLAIKCDSLVVAQVNGHIVVSFSNGDPNKPVLMFSGDLLTVNTDTHFDPYLGPAISAFPIDHVLWGDGSPVRSVRAGAWDKLGARGCYFHFIGQGWGQLSMVECELATMDTPSHRPRRVTVTFRTERQFTVDGQQISVEYGAQGAKSFNVVFNQMKIDGTCGAGLYQIDGVLKHTEPGTPIGRLFQAVCYKDVANSQ
jgi:hypothetical protein